MARPKLSPRDIWRTLILACRRTLSPLAVWKIPMPKITLFFTGIPVVVTAISLVYWISGLYWYFSSVIIRIDYHWKTGTGQFAPFRWTNENLFDMRSSLFKMSDGKKQKSTKLHQNFCCSAWGKEMPRHYGLGNRCMSTSCHSATMTILAMHLLGR